jgi:hypothetical protein
MIITTVPGVGTGTGPLAAAEAAEAAPAEAAESAASPCRPVPQADNVPADAASRPAAASERSTSRRLTVPDKRFTAFLQLG